VTVVDLYTIQIVSGSGYDPVWSELDQDRISAIIAETEENLTDLLPAGYSARIRRWDHPEPDSYPGTRDSYCRRTPGCGNIDGHPGPCSKRRRDTQ
jgi:hypothetical protein